MAGLAELGTGPGSVGWLGGQLGFGWPGGLASWSRQLGGLVAWAVGNSNISQVLKASARGVPQHVNKTTGFITFFGRTFTEPLFL